jgi:hypothetical protein
MNDFEKDVIERLARLETKQDSMAMYQQVMDKKMDTHIERHYSFGLRVFIAVFGAVVSLFISIFK